MLARPIEQRSAGYFGELLPRFQKLKASIAASPSGIAAELGKGVPLRAQAIQCLGTIAAAHAELDRDVATGCAAEDGQREHRFTRGSRSSGRGARAGW